MFARLAVIVAAYLAAAAAAGMALSIVWAFHEYGSLAEILPRILPRAVVFGAFSAMAGLPAIAAIAYTEYMLERRYLFFGIFGVLMGVLPMLLTAPSEFQTLSSDTLVMIAIFGGTGWVASTVYWLIAGRYGAPPAGD